MTVVRERLRRAAAGGNTTWRQQREGGANDGTRAQMQVPPTLDIRIDARASTAAIQPRRCRGLGSYFL